MEQLDTILQKLGAAPLWQKAVGLAAAMVLLIAGYYFVFLDDVRTQRTQMLADQEKLNKERTDYEARKKEYLAYRAEIAGLEEEQKDILRLLPKKDDIEQFVEAMQQQIELAGLTKVAMIRGGARPQGLYIRLPVKLTVFGTYHQLMRFLKSLSEIPRIVNVDELSLNPTAEKGTPDLLKAEFISSAFQYNDKASGPKKAGPADPNLKTAATAAGGGGTGAK